MRDEATPIVSVIVPIYNVEATLDQALASIEAQTLSNIEIVCVNDGSTDSSPEIIQQHVDADPRVKFIDKPNGGYGSACNRGMSEAHGEWIAILEPDDWIEPNMFEDMIGFARSLGTPVDIVKTPYWRVVSPDSENERTLNCSYKGLIRPKTQPFTFGDESTIHLVIHHPSIWSALYRRSFLEENNIKFREIPGAGWADNPFLFETLCQARSVAYLDQAYYHYREETPEEAAATVRRNPHMLFDRWEDMMDVLERLDVQDEPIRRALTRRGFTYLSIVDGATDLFRPDLHARMVEMFARMDDELVFSEAHISPSWKTLYAKTKSISPYRASKLPYLFSLAGIGVYNLVNVGPSFTLQSMKGFLGNDAGQSAEDERTDKTGQVKISIIVPVYNSASFLEACFKSLSEQTYQNFEVIFVNDGSTDDSGTLLSSFAQSNPRVKVIDQSNGGPSKARNAGIRAASGDFILFLDSDDLLEPDACSQIARYASYGSTDAVVFGWTCFDGKPDHWTASRGDVSDAFYPSFSPALLFDKPTQPFLRLAVRRSLLMENDVFFDESLHLGEDAAFLFAALPLAHGVRLVSNKLYRYRLPHEGSLMQQAAHDGIDECLQGLNAVISVFDSWAKHGFLEQYGADLVAWSVKYSLYTILRQEEPLREELCNVLRELWLAHWTESQMRAMNLPAHTKTLAAYALEQKKTAPERDLLAYRLAEYGPIDLARTALDRL